MVVVVHLGTRPSGGYRVDINKVGDKEGILEIYFTETIPGDNCFTAEILTQPHHMISVTKSTSILRFIGTKKTVSCYGGWGY